EVAIAHQQAPAPRLPGDDDFTVATNRVLARSLAKRPEERYADAAALQDALLAAAALDPAAAGARRRGHARLAGVAVVGALVLGGALAAGDRLAGEVDAPGPGATSAGPAAGGPVTADVDGDGYGDLVVRMTAPDGTGAPGTPVLSTWW